MKNYKLLAICLTFLLMLSCASTTNNSAASNLLASSKKQSATIVLPESGVVGNFPANSPFSKIKIGMTQDQVHQLLGQPTDIKAYQTGKAGISFYLGQNVMRFDEFYKNVGTVIYVGAGASGVHWTVFQATYNQAEDGISSK